MKYLDKRNDMIRYAPEAPNQAHTTRVKLIGL